MEGKELGKAVRGSWNREGKALGALWLEGKRR
jgi:hypothetical protein